MHPASQPVAGHFDRPRFRQDLIAELVDDQGARFIDVMDPDSGNLFRFYEVEYSLACGMDGERDIAGIVKWAQEELGLTPSPQEVRSVISTLGDLGFIDSGDSAAAQPAPDLGPGVVIGPPPRVQPPSHVELGAAGSGAAAAPGVLGRPPEPASDIALGASGRGSARPTPRPTPSPPSPLSSSASASASEGDVSVDLADHIAVRKSDVQEAVRASKVMSAVDVPQEVLDAIEDKPTAKAAQPAFERPPEVLRTPEPIADPPRPRADSRVGKPPLTRHPPTKPPVELPGPPPAAVATPVPADKAVQSKAGSRGPLLIVLLVVAVAAGAFLLWKYVLDKPAQVSTSEPAPPPVKPEPPPPPPPPPAPTAKVAMEVPAPDDVKTTRAGVIETILADKTAVKAGDVVVRLVGDKPIEAEIAGLARDQKKLQDIIDTYTKRRDTAKAAGTKAGDALAAASQNEIDNRQKTLAAKQAQLAAKTLELDKFLLHAANSGTFSPAVKLGQKITADDVVATLQRDSIPGATFKVPSTAAFSTGTSAELAVGKGELRVTCAVTSLQSEASTIKVICPVDPALTEGTDVTLKLPAAPADAAPAMPPPAEPAGAGSGSAPGSAAQ